jgi:hypothetical protein
MEIEQSSLYREVEEVINSSAKPVHYKWQAEVHVGDDTYSAIKVLSIDDRREYDTNFAEEVMLEVTFGLGTFAYDIYPNQDALDVTLTRIPLNEAGDAETDSASPQAERYTATLVDTGNFKVEANGANVPSRETLNLVQIHTCEFQLQRKAVEQMRLVSVGMRMRGCTVEEAIKSILTNESTQINVDDLQKPKGVDMVPASNQTKREHIIVNDGVRLVDVPQYIHEKCGGVYSSGLGYFYDQDYWHIYPCYDTERFAEAKYTMTVVNVPKNKFPRVERSYNQDGDHVTVLATGDVKFSDDSNIMQLNAGNGVRFMDANAIVNRTNVQVQGNKATAARARNTSEFTTVPRPNGINNVQLSDAPITANPYLEYSKMARRNGAFLQFIWENSNPSLLFPGMMAKILYLDGDDIKEVHGVLLKAHTQHKLEGQGMTSTRYRSFTVLVFFTQRVTE